MKFTDYSNIIVDNVSCSFERSSLSLEKNQLFPMHCSIKLIFLYITKNNFHHQHMSAR